MVPAASMPQGPARVMAMGVPVQMPGVIMTPQPATMPVETAAVPVVSTSPAAVSKATPVVQVPQMTPVSSITQVPQMTPVSSISQVPQMTPVSSITQVPQMTPVSSITQVPQVVPKAAASAPKQHPQLNLKPHTGSRRGSIEKPRGLTDEQIRDMVGELRPRDA